MATYEGKLKSMETKIKLLKLTDEETQRTIEKGHVPSLERQQRVLKTKLEEVYSLKVEIQELKIQSDEETDNILKEFTPKRRAAKIAKENIRLIAEEEEEEH
ncbi:Hypothetical predicted protein [Paramuricea clavata]|uniref:Uncharacterized protein n=1 Tax=Paramuricea clavata TaxID=317549 RepID=A0A6S7H6C4_PARCT|nr:Hypothetical predicted protein [Paramuricea clavata]